MYLEAQRGDTKKPGTFPEEGPVFAFTLWKKATKLSDIIEWRKTEKKLKQRGLKMSDRRKWGKEKRRIGECREKSNYLPASGCYDSSWQAGRAAAYCKAFIITVHQPIFPPHAFSSHNFSMCTARELLNPLSYLWLQLCSVFVGLWVCGRACLYLLILGVCVCSYALLNLSIPKVKSKHLSGAQYNYIMDLIALVLRNHFTFKAGICASRSPTHH